MTNTAPEYLYDFTSILDKATNRVGNLKELQEYALAMVTDPATGQLQFGEVRRNGDTFSVNGVNIARRVVNGPDDITMVPLVDKYYTLPEPDRVRYDIPFSVSQLRAYSFLGYRMQFTAEDGRFIEGRPTAFSGSKRHADGSRAISLYIDGEDIPVKQLVSITVLPDTE